MAELSTTPSHGFTLTNTINREEWVVAVLPYSRYTGPPLPENWSLYLLYYERSPA